MPRTPVILVGQPADVTGTDCACPEGGLEIVRSPRPSAGALWQRAAALYRAPLAGEFEVVVHPLGVSNVVVLDRAAAGLLDRFAAPRPFDHAGPGDAAALAHLAELGLLHPAGRPLRLAPARSHTLSAWLHITNDCNLRCTYCYVPKTAEAMDEATGIAAVEAVFRSAQRNGFRAVKLKYAGGEATLNFRLVQALHRHAMQLAERAGIALREVVLSNGVALTPAMIAFLRETGMRLMISLDGASAAHDAQRVFANGRGSFLPVSRAIDRALQLGLEPHLSITVTGRNAGALAEIVAFALDRNLAFNLNFYRESDCAAGGLQAEHRQLVAGVRAAFAVIAERLPERRLIDGLLDRSGFDQPHEHACGAGLTYLAVNHRGGVARCQMELDRAVTTVADDDPLGHIRLEPGGFQNTPSGDREGCAECTFRLWCAGGCPRLSYLAAGRNDRRSPLCEVYQALYPDVLRLEGLRLVRWARTRAPGA